MGDRTTPKRVMPSPSAGTWLICSACGRMLKIEWPTRSILCSCGERLQGSSEKKESGSEGA